MNSDYCVGVTPLHCVNIYHCDWLNKKADWPVARQDKVRRENQTTRMLGRRRRILRSHQPDLEEATRKHIDEANEPQGST